MRGAFCPFLFLSVSWRGGFQEPSQNAEPLFAHICLSLLVSTELLPAEETEQDKEHTCETLLMCIVTVLSHGLRSGGGVGDVLRKPSKEVAASLHSPGRDGSGLGGQWAHSQGATHGQPRSRDTWPRSLS